MKEGKHVGKCKHCGLMLADFDEVHYGYLCQRCGETTNPEELNAQSNAETSVPVSGADGDQNNM